MTIRISEVRALTEMDAEQMLTFSSAEPGRRARHPRRYHVIVGGRPLVLEGNPTLIHWLTGYRHGFRARRAAGPHTRQIQPLLTADTQRGKVVGFRATWTAAGVEHSESVPLDCPAIWSEGFDAGWSAADRSQVAGAPGREGKSPPGDRRPHGTPAREGAAR